MPNYIKYSLIAILAALLFIPFLGHVHLFDWDEINFAECAREMIVTKDYLRVQIDYMPFWEKPPLFIWMQVLTMKLLGVGEFAARLPNACIGIATLLTLFYAGKKIINERMGMWWVAIYAACWLPHFYFKSGIIDPTFNFFIFLSFLQLHFVRYSEKKYLHATLSGLFLGLAVLTKGPVAILIVALSFVVFLIINKGLWGYRLKHLLVIALATVVTFSIWFGIEIINHGFWFVNEFLRYQVRLFRTEDADHGGPFFYHFIILLVGCFPASIFLFQYTRKRVTGNEPSRNFTRLMWILFWVVLLLFSIVKTKIVHYSSLCYFPLTYLAALQVYRLSTGEIKLKRSIVPLLVVLGVLVAIAIGCLPLVGIYKQKIIPYIDDPFAVGNLQANVSWSYLECIWGFAYLVGIIVAGIWIRKNFKKGMIMLCCTQIIIIQIAVAHFTPKVEAYSQRAAIDFFRGLKGQDVYIQVLGYKSYAQLFYAEKKPSTNPMSHNEEWLLNGKVDKPVYFICKIQNADKYRVLPQLQDLGSRNGFTFFKRK
ncbi:MAG: glycosyltransferase family 39 protein [Taibaiella sp.]|nr:glycosyltransferase family 39 protein [Taibaiella sp.]